MLNLIPLFFTTIHAQQVATVYTTTTVTLPCPTGVDSIDVAPLPNISVSDYVFSPEPTPAYFETQPVDEDCEEEPVFAQPSIREEISATKPTTNEDASISNIQVPIPASPIVPSPIDTANSPILNTIDQAVSPLLNESSSSAPLAEQDKPTYVEHQADNKPQEPEALALPANQPIKDPVQTLPAEDKPVDNKPSEEKPGEGVPVVNLPPAETSNIKPLLELKSDEVVPDVEPSPGSSVSLGAPLLSVTVAILSSLFL